MLGTAKFITLEAAKKMAAAGEAEARKNGWNVAIAIVDASGGLILFQSSMKPSPAALPLRKGKRERPRCSSGPPRRWKRPLPAASRRS